MTRFRAKHTKLKKLLIKRVAFVMGMFYLISPFQNQLSDALHMIAHTLSFPDYVLEHSERNSVDSNLVHHYGEHRTEAESHRHKFIDFVQSVLESSKNEERSSETNLPKVTTDKHLVAHVLKIKNTACSEQQKLLVAEVKNATNGHARLWLEPPIYSSI